ncbi:MAG: hypothetical protein IT423_11590 [Pirellulaceae bacterium]|nr:hypothetical protein [Pirellulaceae bacterium]
MSVATDLSPGFYEAWAVGRHGASYPRVFWVSPRPVVTVPQAASENGPFPTLPSDGVVVDKYVAAKVQRYELPLTVGQRVRIIALDAKLESRALSHIRVASPSGRLVASARSEGTSGAVAELTAEQAGNYRVELRDAIYRGGDEFTYAVYVESADQPPLDSARAVWSDRAQVLAALKPGAGQLTPARQLAGLAIARWLSADSSFVSAHTPRAEPVDITLPCLVQGVFSTNAKGEAFQFTAKKGDVYYFDVASDILGENTDAYLAIYKVTTTDGKVKLDRVAEQDDAPAMGSAPFRVTRSDPSLRWSAPDDATYHVTVRDQLATSSATAGRKYVLAIRKPQPALDLMAAWAYPINNQAQAKPIGNNLIIGGSLAIRVVAGRADGLTGAIEVTCEGLPPGVVAPPIIIPADRDEGHLILSCPAQTPSAVAPLKIIGRVLGDQNPPVQAEAVAAALTWEPMPTWNTLVGRLSQQLVLSVNEQDSVPVTFQVGGDQPLVMARGGKLPIPIAVTRRPGGADKAVLRAQALPTKTTLADVTIEGSAKDAKPELVIAADAPIGEATFWFQTETKVKFRNNPQALQRAEAHKAALEKIQADPARAAEKDAVAAALKAATDRITQLKDPTGEKEVAVFLPTNSVRVKIVEAPLEPAGVWRIEAKRGTQSEHVLAVKRLFGLDSAIDIKLAPEPAAPGVEFTAPPVDAKADQTKASIKLAADAAAGERMLKAKLSYKFNNQDMSITLPLVLSVTE